LQAFRARISNCEWKPGSKRPISQYCFASIQTTNHADFQGFRETGATGLEPATSGVTGRYELNRFSRL
jgi:hypothetical protein